MKRNIITSALALLCATLSTITAHAADELPGIAAQPATYFYTGKPYDEDIGAFTFAFRAYDPQVGRWSTVDPSGFYDGPNPQIYTPVPTSMVDPLGCWKIRINSDDVFAETSVLSPATVTDTVGRQLSFWLSGAASGATFSGDSRAFITVGGSATYVPWPYNNSVSAELDKPGVVVSIGNRGVLTFVKDPVLYATTNLDASVGIDLVANYVAGSSSKKATVEAWVSGSYRATGLSGGGISGSAAGFGAGASASFTGGQGSQRLLIGTFELEAYE